MRVYIVTGPAGDIWDVFLREEDADVFVIRESKAERMRPSDLCINEWEVK